MKKRLLALCLALTLCLTLLPVSARAAAVWDGKPDSYIPGSGSAEDPFQVSTAAQLDGLRRAINLGDGYKINSKDVPNPCHVQLVADIVFNEGTFDTNGNFIDDAGFPQTWASISGEEISIHFDGNGHSISGMCINSTGNKVGLFGYIKNGSIRDLTIKNSLIRTTGNYAGAFAGEAYNTSFTNCVSENNLIVTTNGAEYGLYAGGIAGYVSSATIAQCRTVGGTVSGNGYLGGLFGQVNRVTIQNCWNTATVETGDGRQKDHAGGIVGEIYGSTNIYNCCNLGSISGAGELGGIVGRNGNNVTIKNCYSVNNVTRTFVYAKAGKLIGWRGSPVLESCYTEDGGSCGDVGTDGSIDLPHFTGKGALEEGGDEGALCEALNDYLYEMGGVGGLLRWTQDAGGYPLPTGSEFVDDTVYYGVWLDDIHVSERNYTDILKNGMASYDPTTNTLTLEDGFDLEGSHMNGLLYTDAACQNLTIRLKGTARFHSTSNSGSGPSILDMCKGVGLAGSLTFVAGAGTKASVSVTNVHADYAIDAGAIVLDGDISLLLRTNASRPLTGGTIELKNENAVFEAQTTGGGSAALNTITVIKQPGQKLYEEQNGQMVEVDAFTLNSNSDIPPHIRIAPEVVGYTDLLPNVFTVSMADANDETALQTWVAAQVDAVIGLPTGSVTGITVSGVSPAEAGSYTEQDGTPGSFTAAVTLTYNGIAKTKTIPGTITPTPYTPEAVTAAIQAGVLENGVFTPRTNNTFTSGEHIVLAVTCESGGTALSGLSGTLTGLGVTNAVLVWNAERQFYEVQGQEDGFAWQPGGQDYTVTAVFAESNGYAAADGTLTLTVNKLALTADDFTVTLPQGARYDGAAKTADAQFQNTAAMPATGTVTVEYYKDGAKLAAAPQDAGTYTVRLHMDENDYYSAADLQADAWTFTIAPADSSVTTAPRANTPTYNTTAQALVTAGAASGGTLVYSLAQAGPYSADIPTGTEAGDYTVWYKVQGDGNHADTQPASVAVSIAQADPTYDVPTGLSAVYGDTLGDIALPLPSAGTPGTWSWKAPTQSVGDAVTKTFLAVFTPTDRVNYRVISDIAVSVRVDKAAGSVTAPTAVADLVYNGEVQTLIQPGSSVTGTVLYSLASGMGYSTQLPKAKNAGYYTVYYKVVGDRNHENVDEQFISVRIAKLPVDAPAPDARQFVYTAEEQVYQLAESDAYTIRGSRQTDANKTGHAVTVALKDKRNTCWRGSVDDTADKTYRFIIQPATLTITVLDKSAYVGDAAPDLSAPVLEQDYTVSGLLGSDTLLTGPQLAYDPAAPDMRTTGNAASIVASGASAGGNYAIDYVPGTLTVATRPSTNYTSNLSYPIVVDCGENGTVRTSHSAAAAGTTVTITVTPALGYAPEVLTAAGPNGRKLTLTSKGSGRYTFVMPAGKVTVTASFMDDNTMLNFFVDVAAGDYCYDAVLWAAQNGITSGTDTAHFSPNAPCTRAQIVTFLWRAAGSPAPKNMSSFSDVPADSYYAEAVAWAVEAGITSGTGNGKFSPDAPCTRAQAVTFLHRAAGSPTADGSSAFRDVAPSAYYANAVAWAAENDVTNGIGNSLFGPDDVCTRAQIVTFLYRAFA